MKPAKTPLTATEARRFAACKKQISEGLQTCFDTGLALTEIRDSKLYREDFNTFDEFCRQTYQFGKAYAYRLIGSSEIKQDIESRSPTAAKLITNEQQARALAEVPPGDQVKLLKDLARDGGVVTADAIRAKTGSTFNDTPTTIDRNVSPVGDKSKKQSPEELDKEGWPIPTVALDAWHRAETESKIALAAVSKLRTALKDAEETKDVIYAAFRFQENIAHLTSVFNNLKQVVPHGVCTACQGKLADHCEECKGRGFVSGLEYQMYSKDQVKEMRKKIKAKGSK